MNMQHKKIIIAFCSVILMSTIAIGGTWAYFTDRDSVQNVITIGKVDAYLKETNQIQREDQTVGLDYNHVVPGAKLDKDPTIYLTKDSQDAYLRAKLIFTGDIFEGEDGAKKKEQLEKGLDINPVNWVKQSDGYYYYQSIVTDTVGVPLFTTATIPYEWGNEIASKTFHIEIAAEAIQAN